MYKNIIFDVDGTLIDTKRATIYSLRSVLKEETGILYSEEELKFVIGIPGEVSLPKLGIKDVDRVNRKWNDYLKKNNRLIKVYQGIRELILTLRDLDIHMGIVTSNTRYELEGLLKYFLPLKLMDYINVAICADDTEKHKPNPEPILKFLERSNANPWETIYIGDTVYDKLCAHNAHVGFGLALWGNAYSKDVLPEIVFHSPKDVLEILDEPDLESTDKVLI